MRSIFILAFSFFLSSLSAQTLQWLKSYGGSDEDAYQAIKADSAGNVYALSIFYTNTTIGNYTFTGAGYRDMFIAKYDSSGNVLWAQHIAGANDDIGKAVTVDDAGNCYVLGMFQDTITIGNTILTSQGSFDVFIAKFDSSGNPIWAVSAGGSGSDNTYDIDYLMPGYIGIAGDFSSTALFDTITVTSAMNSNLFIAVYDTAGQIQWIRTSASTGGAGANSIESDQAGNIYFAGNFNDTLYLDTFALASAGSSDLFIAKYTSAGLPVWVTRAGSAVSEGITSIDVDTQGNIYVAGSFQNSCTFDTITITGYGGSDFFVARYSGNGNAVWVRKAGGPTSDNGFSITLDHSGKAWVTGFFTGTAVFDQTTFVSQGSYDAFLAAYDTSGYLVYVTAAGSSGQDYGYGITVDSWNNIYSTGYFNHTISIGAQSVSSNGSGDGFMTKISGIIITTAHEQNISSGNVIAYPCPVKAGEQLTFKMSTAIDNGEIVITNLLGQIVARVENVSGGRYTIPVHWLDRGYYLYQVIDKGKQIAQGKITVL